MLVRSAPGTRCPMENKPRKYISDSTPVEVPNSTFYKRLIRDGSLVPVVAQPPTAMGSAEPVETAGWALPADPYP